MSENMIISPSWLGYTYRIITMPIELTRSSNHLPTCHTSVSRHPFFSILCKRLPLIFKNPEHLYSISPSHHLTFLLFNGHLPFFFCIHFYNNNPSFHYLRSRFDLTVSDDITCLNHPYNSNSFDVTNIETDHSYHKCH